VPVEIHVAPATTGKTAYVLDLVRDAAQGLGSTPRVVVPTHLQVRACRRRLAEAGGAIGVRVLTFDRLYAECLSAAGEVYTELSEPVRYRLLRAIVDDLQLAHYAPLTARPGFVHVLEQLVGELKAAKVFPETLTDSVAALGDEPRLRELAQIYAAYQMCLRARGWADRAGLGWLAVEALEERAPDVARDWQLLAVDGFDSFTPVQLGLLKVLADRVGQMIVALTGTADGSQRPLVHGRFDRTRQQLEEALGVRARPLPRQASRQAPVLVHLEASLFETEAGQVEDAPAQGLPAVQLVEAPDRAGEVRAALRWLKARLVQDNMRPGQVALLARAVPPYRPFILETAAEFGLPVRLEDGLPLRANPAVAALLDLLRLMLPRAEGDPEPALPRRLVIEAWRSPYFDWSVLPEEDAPEPVGIAPGDADALDEAARCKQVISGLSQWDEALEELGQSVPSGAAAQALRNKFLRFVQRMTPPQGSRSYREFVGWLETLIGPDPALESSRYPVPDEPTALRVVAQARDAAETISERDVAALQALKDVLRGLVWAEEAVGSDETVQFVRFFNELVGAVETVTYRLPVRPEREEIVVADVVQARGVLFRAAAVLGLAEGEFPAALSEDPFLRDADRQRLREGHALPLEPSTESAEAEFFYETVTRPRERLLLTRPRLADNGAPWQASPFWEEVHRLVKVQPVRLTSESIPPPGSVASWPELMESLAVHPGCNDVQDWAREKDPVRQIALNAAADLFRLRWGGATDSPFDGDLSGLASVFAQCFGLEHTWSASRLEAYRTCPFFFFVGSVLSLEPRLEPVEGPDARQLGTTYHRIFEEIHQAPEVDDPSDLEQLLAALPVVAARVLDEAAQREGFRETAWWAQTCAEIVKNVERSLRALADLAGEFVPLVHEARFFEPQSLTVTEGEDCFRLHGLIDRVDQAPDGRVRVVDYKTSGPYSFTKKAFAEGKKLQLPLYALAARDALGLGEPVEGFYWHIRHAEPSGFTMSGFEGGPEAAIKNAVEKAWEAIRGARGGHFVPHPPPDGCPSYCPAAAFCWQYRPGFGG
jgi:ATP-dependent helicase/DNAse subunit B